MTPIFILGHKPSLALTSSQIKVAKLIKMVFALSVSLGFQGTPALYSPTDAF